MTKTNGQILIIDDDPGICSTLSDILEDAAYEVRSYDKGRQALDFLRKNAFDVVIVDIKLPDMDGMELLEEIRLINPESAVIMVTGHASVATAADALNKGAYAYVVKPFNLDELKAIIKKAIKTIRLSLENKKLIDQLQRTNRDLERYKESLEERTRELELAIEKARLLGQKATAATEAKSKFLANMSHEIRTPMNAIMGFSDLLAEQKLNAEQKEDVDNIRESAKILLNLLNDILDFSKIEAGQLDIEIIDCSLGKMLNSIESVMRTLAEDKSLDFKIMTSSTLPAQIRTDPTRLHQCLINLVNNAIKFTEQGRVYLKVSLEAKDDNPNIRFDVEDTGIGIPIDRQVAIFESFTQVDGSTTRKYGGTGLGLAITKQLAEFLGGELFLTSEIGKGSTFTLTIPAGVDVAKQPLLDKNNFAGHIRARNDELVQAKFSGNILVAEDAKTNQVLIKALLKRMDLQVTIAEDGNEAIQKAFTHKFDLIFMDIQMPKMNGYEATRALRKEGLKTPIVALTANAMKGDEEKCIEAGCDDYLVKPIDRKKLFEILDKFLSSQKQDDTGKGIDPVSSEVDKLCELYIGESCLDEQLTESTGTRDNEDVIDWSQLVNRGMNEDILKSILPTFLSDKRKRLQKLTEAVKAGDTKEVKFYAHGIKGGAANMGAMKLSQAAYNLERTASQEDLSEAEELLERIKTEFRRFDLFVSNPDWIEIAKQQSVEGVIDWPSLVKRTGDDESFINSIVEAWLVENPARIMTLAEAIEAGDAKKVFALAHTIKGSAGTIGAKLLVESALQLEIAGREGNLENADAMFADIQKEFEKVKSFVSEPNWIQTAKKQDGYNKVKQFC